MAIKKQSDAPQRAASVSAVPLAKSIKLTERPIRSGADFANLMSALMGDILSGRVSPAVGNATCNAGGKLLKVVEMQYRYGAPVGNQRQRKLILAEG